MIPAIEARINEASYLLSRNAELRKIRIPRNGSSPIFLVRSDQALEDIIKYRDDAELQRFLICQDYLRKIYHQALESRLRQG